MTPNLRLYRRRHEDRRAGAGVTPAPLARRVVRPDTLGDAHVLVRGQYVLQDGRVDAMPRCGWYTEVWAHTRQRGASFTIIPAYSACVHDARE